MMALDDTVTNVTLNSTDRTLVWMASRLLLALPGGPARVDALEQLIQHYRDDLADAHEGTDPGTLDDMATNFGGALMLRMERLVDEDDPDNDTPPPDGLCPVRTA
jgi:hypothetical protein